MVHPMMIYLEKVGGSNGCIDASKFFSVDEPKLEKWIFAYFEDLFAQDAGSPSVVNVASKAYRGVSHGDDFVIKSS